jgi:ABC-type Fe3+ transport system permease subunit
MKLTEYLVFAALLIPTVVVAAAAVFSLASPDPVPEYNPPIKLVSSSGLYPADMNTDE